ncbi:DUF6941 family protein, partial [Marinicauda pacifica]|uniref:DUF6941 family protein n=1 Tax=Marinicauda pacifica TaxID=1133559 RepID=UPI0035C79F67
QRFSKGDTSAVSIKADYALVCDSVREEKNGKLIFVGVYTDDIVVGRYPYDMSLQVWLDLSLQDSPSAPENFSIRIRQRAETDILLGELDATLERLDPDKPLGPAHIALPLISFHVQQRCEFIVELKSGDGNWKTILQKPVYCISDSDHSA